MSGEEFFHDSACEQEPHCIERRAHPRWTPQPDTHGKLVVHGTDLALWARVLDISPGGIRVLLNRSLPVGTSFTLDLRNPESNLSCNMHGRVVHVEQLDLGAFSTGAEFEQPFDISELDFLVP